MFGPISTIIMSSPDIYSRECTCTSRGVTTVQIENLSTVDGHHCRTNIRHISLITTSETSPLQAQEAMEVIPSSLDKPASTRPLPDPTISAAEIFFREDVTEGLVARTREPIIRYREAFSKTPGIGNVKPTRTLSLL